MESHGQENDTAKTALTEELVELRRQVAELRAREADWKRLEEALRERERNIRAILDQTFQFFGLISIEGRLIEANGTALRFVGAQESDIMGKLFWETPWWTHSAALQEELRLAVKKAAAGECVRFEANHVSVDGNLCYVDFSLKPVADEAGGVAFLIAEGRDITERKLAEEAVLKANRVINALWECNNALIHEKDELQLLRKICRVIVEVGGYRMAWVGYAEHDASRTVTPVAQCGYDDGYLKKVNVTWADTERGRGPVGTSIRTGIPSVVRHVELQPNFLPWREEAVKRGYASVIGLPLFVEGRVLGCLAIYSAEPDAFDADEVNLLSRLQMNLSFGITTLRTSYARRQAEVQLHKAHAELQRRVEDRTAKLAEVKERVKLEIQERKFSEEELRNSEEKLRFLSARLLTAQEEERKKLAGELHDSIGGSLGAIKFGLENVLKLVEEGAATPKSIEYLLGMTDHTIGEARRIYMNLRPSMLDDLGLLATIGWFTRQFESLHNGTGVERHITVEEEEIPEDLKIVIFRVMQEAFHNIAKYSQADRVTVSLRGRDGSLNLSVTDNGVGFDPAQAAARRNDKGGLGLTSMRERVELSGGVFTIVSTVGEGTTVRAAWDIPLYFAAPSEDGGKQ